MPSRSVLHGIDLSAGASNRRSRLVFPYQARAGDTAYPSIFRIMPRKGQPRPSCCIAWTFAQSDSSELRCRWRWRSRSWVWHSLGLARASVGTRGRRCGGSLLGFQLPDLFFHLLAWLEGYDEFLRDIDTLSGTGISSLPCGPLLDLKHAEIP